MVVDFRVVKRANRDLEDAVALACKAVEYIAGSKPANPGRAIYLAQLGAASRDVWEYQNLKTEALRRAIQSYLQAAEIVTPTNPDYYEYRFLAADAQAHLAPIAQPGHDELPELQRSTINMLEEAFSSELAAAQVRIRAGRSLARLISKDDLAKASETLRSCVAILADLAPAQLEMADRQFVLADLGVLVSEAATTMAIAGL